MKAKQKIKIETRTKRIRTRKSKTVLARSPTDMGHVLEAYIHMHMQIQDLYFCASEKSARFMAYIISLYHAVYVVSRSIVVKSLLIEKLFKYKFNWLVIANDIIIKRTKHECTKICVIFLTLELRRKTKQHFNVSPETHNGPPHPFTSSIYLVIIAFSPSLSLTS